MQVGQNLLSVDLDQVRSNLEMLPLVRARGSAADAAGSVVHSRGRAHRGGAACACRRATWATQCFTIDRSGFVMKPVKLADGTVVQPQTPRPVPMLTGVTLADVRVGKPVESEQIYRALELLDKLDQAVAGSLLEVEQIDLSKPRQLVMTTRQHTTVKLDVEGFSATVAAVGSDFAVGAAAAENGADGGPDGQPRRARDVC